MPSSIAAAVFVLGILGLFVLDRDRKVRTSLALWIPVGWLLIVSSRKVSDWLLAAPQTMTPDLYLEGIPLDRNVYLGLIAVGLVVLVSRGRQVGTVLRRNGPILLFFSYCGLSVLWSDYPFVSFKHWIKGVGDVVMVLLILTDSEPVTALKRLFARTSFLLIPLSVLFIKYYPNLGQEYNRWTWTQEYLGVTISKNMLGMICLVFGLGSLWRFLGAYKDPKGLHRGRRLIAHGALLAMVLWLFSIAHSATSFSCFLLAGGLIAVTNFIRVARKPMVLHLLVATVVFIPAFAVLLDSSGGLIELVGRDPTITGRTEIWNVVLSLSGNPLVGTGYESYWLGDRLQQVWAALSMPGLQEAHNGYLELFLNLGWIGVTLLALLIVTGYRNVVLALRRDEYLGSIKLAYFVVGVVYSLSEAGFRMLAPVWIFFLLAVMAVPKVSVPESASPLEIELTHNFVECESEVDHVFH